MVAGKGHSTVILYFEEYNPITETFSYWRQEYAEQPYIIAVLDRRAEEIKDKRVMSSGLYEDMELALIYANNTTRKVIAVYCFTSHLG